MHILLIRKTTPYLHFFEKVQYCANTHLIPKRSMLYFIIPVIIKSETILQSFLRTSDIKFHQTSSIILGHKYGGGRKERHILTFSPTNA